MDHLGNKFAPMSLQSSVPLKMKFVSFDIPTDIDTTGFSAFRMKKRRMSKVWRPRVALKFLVKFYKTYCYRRFTFAKSYVFLQNDTHLEYVFFLFILIILNLIK